jgi:hypothetical protein
MTQKTYTLDDIDEAQAKVIRAVFRYLKQNSRASRSRHLFYGARRLMAYLRYEFSFTERQCTVCLRWRGEKHFYKHPTGLFGLQSKCKECTLIINNYGSIRKCPHEVLMELRGESLVS